MNPPFARAGLEMNATSDHDPIPVPPGQEPDGSAAAAAWPPREGADLAEVLESFSFWLSDSLSVELTAYWNPPRRKSQMVGAAGAGERENLERIVERIIHGATPRIRHWRQQQWFFHLWVGAPLDTWDRLLIVEREGSLSTDEFNGMIQEVGPALHQALHRALHVGEGGEPPSAA